MHAHPQDILNEATVFSKHHDDSKGSDEQGLSQVIKRHFKAMNGSSTILEVLLGIQ
jgi:hypothetical protein